jgi:outer membrane immunogenic protein
VKKSILFVAAVVSLGTVGAAADELPNRPSMYIFEPTPSQPWTGFYVGVNGGYGWADSSVNYSANDAAAQAGTCGGAGRPSGLCIPTVPFTLNGGTVGGQIGYDWQITEMWLTGVVADYQWADFSAGGASAFRLGNVGSTDMLVSEKVDSFGTVRARMGAIVASSVLLYGTAGLAYGQVKETFNVPNPNVAAAIPESMGGFSYSCPNGGPPCFAGSTSKTELGWTIGGGGEYRITNNISFETEILYVQVSSPNGTATALTNVAGTTPSSFAATFPDVRLIVARGGLNFKF